MFFPTSVNFPYVLVPMKVAVVDRASVEVLEGQSIASLIKGTKGLLFEKENYRPKGRTRGQVPNQLVC